MTYPEGWLLLLVPLALMICGAAEVFDDARITANTGERKMADTQGEKFYIQDTRSYCGNSVMWWRVDGNGYTSNLDEAWQVSGDWKGRNTDKLWPVVEINARATRQFDMQLFREIKK